MIGDAAVISQKLSELIADDPGFTILLSHRPELFDSYVDHDMDLALSGYAHGGQFRRFLSASWRTASLSCLAVTAFAKAPLPTI